jgi:GxxExxY protein
MTASDDEVLKLCDQVRQTAFELHAFLRHGHLERVYENGLVHRLRKLDIRVEQQHPLSVSDEDGTLLGEYCADLFIESCLIVELKACRAIAPEHLAQLLGYLRATRTRHGMLINFGAQRLEVKKMVMYLAGASPFFLPVARSHCSSPL